MADQKIAPPMRLVDTSGGTANTAIIDASGNLAIKLNSVGAVTVPVSGTFWQATQPVSGTITANIGTSGSLALDASVTGLQVSIGSTTSGQKGGLMMGAVTTAAPSYTTAQTNPLSLTTAGALRVDIGTNGQVAATQSGTWNITNISGTVSLPTGAATAAKQPALGTAGSASSDVITVQGIASMTALKVDGSAVTQPVSGTITANIGTSGSLALDATLTGGTQRTKLTDGTNNATLRTAGARFGLDVAIVDGSGNQITTFGGADTPTSPVMIYTTSSSLAAGSSTTTAHQTADLATGTYYCSGFDVSSSVPVKAALYTVLNGTQSTNPFAVVFVQAGNFGQWKPPHRQYMPFTSAGAAGFDGFRVVVTNMDGSEAADTYVTLYYQSN